MTGWKPIETAPKDGSVFLGFWIRRIRLAAWNIECGNWQEYPDGDFEILTGEELTHWMPLPDPPAEASA